MTAGPWILARTLKESHRFAEERGFVRGRYRVVNSSGTLKSVRGADLYLVPGWEKRFDRFAMKSAIRWTRMNVIDVAAEVPQIIVVAVPDSTEPPQYHTDLVNRVIVDNPPPQPVVTYIDSHDFVTSVEADQAADIVSLGRTTVDAVRDDLNPPGEQLTLTPEAPAEPAKNRRRRRCKDCGSLHFKDDPCSSTEE